MDQELYNDEEDEYAPPTKATNTKTDDSKPPSNKRELARPAKRKCIRQSDEKTKKPKEVSLDLNQQVNLLGRSLVQVDENNNEISDFAYCLNENKRFKIDHKQERPIVVPEGYDPNAFKVENDKGTLRYLQGQEPKIVSQQVDSSTGKYSLALLFCVDRSTNLILV